MPANHIVHMNVVHIVREISYDNLCFSIGFGVAKLESFRARRTFGSFKVVGILSICNISTNATSSKRKKKKFTAIQQTLLIVLYRRLWTDIDGEATQRTCASVFDRSKSSINLAYLRVSVGWTHHLKCRNSLWTSWLIASNTKCSHIGASTLSVLSYAPAW